MKQKELITIQEYADSKEITLTKLAEITGVSFDLFNHKSRIKDYRYSLDSIIKIYEGTLKEFGEGLPVWYYMSVPKFWENK